MNLGPFLFAAPWALTALAALPALWWLLRATPPPPQRALFPPTRLLLGLSTDEQSRERAPLWLVLFRALAATLLIVAFARPSLAPSAAELVANGRTLIVIDDGWTSAPAWSSVRAAALASVAEAERARAPVFMLLTAPSDPARDPGEALTAADARVQVTRLEPKAWRPDRADAARRLAQTVGDFARVVWISDGLHDAGAEALAAELQRHGPVTVHLPDRTARALVAAAVTPAGVEASVLRAGGPAGGAIAAETLEGRSLGAVELDADGHALIELPPEIAARAARVRLVGEESAGAVRLLAAGAARPFVGLIDPGGAGQSLTSDLYYAERALQPYAALERGSAAQLIDARAQALILSDGAGATPADRTAIARWVEQGGLLIRFAGPRLANDADELLPVRLRPGARNLGGALAWENALAIASFPQDSPFAGLASPPDVVTREQVLAEPASLAEARVWATLSDNSPLVTAAQRGRGLVVLFHVSAGPAWSDLPLSGLYVDMLRRALAFAGRAEGAGDSDIAGGPFTPTLLIDGFGALAPAPPDADAIPAEAFEAARASSATPPGLYERAGVSAAIDAARVDETLTPLSLPDGIARAGLGETVERPLSGAFFAAAALMLAVDLVIALFLIGRLPRLRALARGGAAAVVLALIALAPQAHAQTADDPTLTLHLAYVRTGDARADRIAAAGLQALTDTLINRTSVEPGAPVGVDLSRDDLSAFPFLYWAAPSTPRPLSDAALANLDRYLAVGGTVLIDTRDAGAGAGARPAATMLTGLDTPPLEQVTAEHVLARAFYLLRSFPGRTQTTQVWAESAAAAASRDGVAALFIGNGDWAAAWAGEADLAGGARQRELALRFGVNLVMVALTGNYKADQVHLPALLERMGER